MHCGQTKLRSAGRSLGTYFAEEVARPADADFHIGLPAHKASLVEVEFTPLADDRTRVVLTQSRWEAFGQHAEMMRGGYGSSWAMIFASVDYQVGRTPSTCTVCFHNLYPSPVYMSLYMR